MSTVVVVGIHRDEVVAPDAQHVGGLAQRIVPAARHQDGEPLAAKVLHGLEHAFLGDAAEVSRRAAEPVARGPQGGDVGDGAAGTEGAQGVAAVLHPLP
jgi:hypothetical protein